MRLLIALSVLVAFTVAVPPEKAKWMCTMCKDLVAMVGQLIGEDESTVQQKLDGYCDELGPLASGCKQFVDGSLKKIVDMLNNGSTDLEICQEFGMCSGSFFLQEKQLKSVFECTMCEGLISFAAQFLGQDESAVQQKLDGFCTDLGPLAGECKKVVDTYLKQIIQYLESGETADVICQKIGMCSSQVSKVSMTKLMPAKKSVKSPKLSTCSVCQDIVSAASTVLNLGTVGVKAYLDSYCYSIPFVGSECASLVNKYVDEIVTYLKDGMSVDDVCKKIDLCSAFEKVLLKQFAQRAMVRKMELQRQRQPKDFECDLCVEIAKEVGKYLNDDESDIVKNLESYCSYLGPLADQCKQLVDEYVPKMISYLNDGKSDKEACTDVGLCSSSKKAFIAFISKKQKKDFKCDLCQEVCYEIGKYLDEDESQIQQTLDGWCDDLPIGGSTCKEVVDAYLPQLVALLKDNSTDLYACQEIDLCASRREYLPKKFQRVKHVNFGVCDLCMDLVTFVADEVANHSTTLEADCDKYCEEYAGPLVSLCESLVHDELPKFVQYIEAGNTPKEICQDIDACSKKTFKKHIDMKMKKLMRSVVIKEKPQPKDLECDLCTEIAKEVGKYLNDDESDIVKNLESYCSYLGPLASQCKQLVDEYVPKMIAYLNDGKSDQEACTDIGLCSSRVKKVQFGVCDLCMDLVTFVADEVANHSTTLEADCDKYCEEYAGPLVSLCESLVHDELPKFVQYIEAGNTPKEICQDIDACSKVTFKKYINRKMSTILAQQKNNVGGNKKNQVGNTMTKDVKAAPPTPPYTCILCQNFIEAIASSCGGVQWNPSNFANNSVQWCRYNMCGVCPFSPNVCSPPSQCTGPNPQPCVQQNECIRFTLTHYTVLAQYISSGDTPYSACKDIFACEHTPPKMSQAMNLFN